MSRFGPTRDLHVLWRPEVLGPDPVVYEGDRPLLAVSEAEAFARRLPPFGMRLSVSELVIAAPREVWTRSWGAEIEGLLLDMTAEWAPGGGTYEKVKDALVSIAHPGGQP